MCVCQIQTFRATDQKSPLHPHGEVDRPGRWPLDRSEEEGRLNIRRRMHAPPCFTVGNVFFSTKASPFFSSKRYLLRSWPKKFYFGFFIPKHIFPKGFRLLKVFFCILQKLNFVLRSYKKASLWKLCHVGLCCLKYAVSLSCEQIYFFRSSFAVMGFSEHFLPDLVLSSTVPLSSIF